MRLRTYKLPGTPWIVQHSRYVQCLRWLAEKLYDRADNIVERAFEA